MKAERRACERKRVSLDILVNYDLSYPRIWKTRDLSMTGVFVTMRRVDLPPGARVEAVLILEYSDDYAPYQFPAQIIRITEEGLALRFQEYDELTYLALQHLLTSH